MRFLLTLALVVSMPSEFVCSEDLVIPLEAAKVLPVEGPRNIQPSGLTILESSLFVVSDKHDNTIFRVQLMKDKALLVAHIQFELDEPFTEGVLDFEGITCDREGNFYIVSETAFRILKVEADGRKASWLTPSLRFDGEKAGLFQTKGAYLEGIALTNENRFVVCAERQPRGLIEIDTNVEPAKASAIKYDHTRAELPKDRHPDFTGLFWENGSLYALQRNAYALCRLTRRPQGLYEDDFWSYESVVMSREFQYDNMRFGRAEGLCMDDNYVYVILDNNGDARLVEPHDHRPLLLILRRPYTTQ